MQGSLQRTTARGEGNQPKGETYVVGSNTAGAEPSKPFKTEAQVPDTEPQKSVLALQHPSIS